MVGHGNQDARRGNSHHEGERRDGGRRKPRRGGPFRAKPRLAKPPRASAQEGLTPDFPNCSRPAYRQPKASRGARSPSPSPGLTQGGRGEGRGEGRGDFPLYFAFSLSLRESESTLYSRSGQKTAFSEMRRRQGASA